MKKAIVTSARHDATRRVLVEAVMFLAEDYGLPEYALPLTCLLNGDDWSFVEKMKSLDWRQASCPRAAYLLHEVFSKSDFLDIGVDREWASRLKYLESEESCYHRNQSLSWYFDPCTPLKTGGTLRDILFWSRRKIGQVLGAFDADELLDSCEFGKGASVGIPRRNACLANKIGCIQPTVTTGLRVLAQYVVGWNRAWFVQQGRDGSEMKISDAARIVTVPKNFKADRMICVEPLMNSYIQRGIGVMMRRRLLREGVNLRDQSRNQSLAYQGSVSKRLATVDLSSASDTISAGLVDSLFPRDWYEYMFLSRTAWGEFDNQIERFEKFSAMGNGYTFEMESLIFYSIACAVANLHGEGTSPISVYGDDIILSSSLVPALAEVFSLLGFTLNSDKTFFGSDGFRESCGKHYLDGVDVTPFYFRTFSKGCTELLILAANNLKRWSACGGDVPLGYDGRSRRAYEKLVSGLPSRAQRPRIPDGMGDGALIGSRNECKPKHCPKGLAGLLTQARVPVVRQGTPEREEWSYLAWLHRYTRNDRSTLAEIAEDAHTFDKLYSRYWVPVRVFTDVTPWPYDQPWLPAN